MLPTACYGLAVVQALILSASSIKGKHWHSKVLLALASFREDKNLGPVKMYIGISVFLAISIFLAISTDIRFSKNILNRLEQVCKPSLG